MKGHFSGFATVLLVLAGLGFWGASQQALGDAVEAEAAAPSTTGPARVVLLHGLGRSAGSMSDLQEALEQSGYVVTNIDYPGTRTDFASLVAQVRTRVDECCSDSSAPIHFITHSLGGILVRALIAEKRPANLGRVVMLSPPNQGSEWVDALGDYALFRTATGPTAQELGTDESSMPSRLGPVDFELGVLTGDASWNPIGSWIIPGDDDGVVGVERARVEGMADFRVLSENHTTIMQSEVVIAEALTFLSQGRFTPLPE